MKIFAFIMAFLVLSLGIMPCADAGASITDVKAKSEIGNTTDQHAHDASDACSPFCHCACCAGFSINHFIASIVLIPPYSISSTSSFLRSSVTDVILPVWQPPQIV
ncbi:MAG: DUF6660 family protein [Chitinophagaceae bacterium]